MKIRRRERKNRNVLPKGGPVDVLDALSQDALSQDDLSQDDLSQSERSESDSGSSDVKSVGLVFPEGVDEIVCDRHAQVLSRHEVSAVVVGNRLLILPIAGALLDHSMHQVVPDSTIWEALGIQESGIRESGIQESGVHESGIDLIEPVIDLDMTNLAEPDQAESGVGVPNMDHAADGSSTSEVVSVVPQRNEPRRRFPFRKRAAGPSLSASPEHPSLRQIGEVSTASGEPGGHVLEEQQVAPDYVSPVELARPLRSGGHRSLPAAELTGVVHDVGRSAIDRLPSQSSSGNLHADMQVLSGQFVAIVGAKNASSRTLFSLIVGLETPDAGMVLHHGVPVEVPGNDKARFDHSLPGVLPLDLVIPNAMSVEDFVAYPMLTYDIDPPRAQALGRRTLADVGLGQMIGQPINELGPVDRRRAWIARALTGPWSTRYLCDPLHGFDDSGAALIRSCILRRVGTGEALVVLTDDPDLLRAADRVIGINDGRLYEAVRRPR
jgi:putative ABC transport system ATP-binding protein